MNVARAVKEIRDEAGELETYANGFVGGRNPLGAYAARILRRSAENLRAIADRLDRGEA